MTKTISREQLNEAINEFADKIMEALGAAVADEDASEPELTSTRFKAIDTDGAEVKVDAVELRPGTLVTDGGLEYFRCYTGGEIGPWVKYTGMPLTHDDFAEEMRATPTTPRIIHEG